MNAGGQLGELLTFKAASGRLGISLRQFRRLVDSGRVSFVKLSERCVRVRPEELNRFLESTTVRIPQGDAS